MGNKPVIEVDGSQELVKRLDGIGFLYLHDAVNSVSRGGGGGGDAILLIVWPKILRVDLPKTHLTR